MTRTHIILTGWLTDYTVRYIDSVMLWCAVGFAVTWVGQLFWHDVMWLFITFYIVKWVLAYQLWASTWKALKVCLEYMYQNDMEMQEKVHYCTPCYLLSDSHRKVTACVP